MMKYLTIASYSAGTWARLMRGMDDRASNARKVAECLGGSLEGIYWEVSTRSVYTILNTPDSTSLAAVAAAVTQTGAFKTVDVHELLTQDQLRDALELARDVSQVYQVPGQPADTAT